MSISPDSEWRGAAAAYPQPLEDEFAVEALMGHVYDHNCRFPAQPLDDIIYRSSGLEEDITRHVFRWDRTNYRQVFLNGFEARRQEGTPDATYFNLERYIHAGGRPLDLSRPVTYTFVSTTLNSSWRPPLDLQEGEETEIYRYEIYAPGGIWVAATLGDQYRYPAQDEVSFVGAIAPQYIRSAQLYRARREHGSRFTRWSRADNVIIVNGHFDPQSHPSRLLMIQRPIYDYRAEDGTRMPLRIRIFQPRPVDDNNNPRVKRRVSVNAENWYADKVGDHCIYIISSAFRASATNEAYIFLEDKYVLVNYAPETTRGDRIINGPLLICDGFHSLIGTPFGEHGIDCAFDTGDGTKAFIFSSNLCAYIDYAPGSTNDKILRGPKPIKVMFPFFRQTVFENGIDSAFKSTATNEAYLFREDQYALINYSSNDARLIAIGSITERFTSLKYTTFQRGIDAAFASHRNNEAYIFKEDQYARFNFTDDHLIGSVKYVYAFWPSLLGLILEKNRGIDAHDHHDQEDEEKHPDLL